ncbi:hypothetical protein SADUNF_Sadunf14G0125400 [Salix dunnii]|uniref:Uncharacterized protein n=1 Tax=Salix dunnii TaxID=1413687 RepID=A0A835JHN9_9ROSI|nr:hypothetical protein SADUNF_Sadunf14G0125400 [Salix dunnii]
MMAWMRVTTCNDTGKSHVKLSQDCLRDQIENPVTPSAPTQIGLEKRSRGKERFRRKCRRKDETREYQASEVDQSEFYGAIIVADQLHLHRADGEEDDTKPGNATEDINEPQPCKDANNVNDSSRVM